MRRFIILTIVAGLVGGSAAQAAPKGSYRLPVTPRTISTTPSTNSTPIQTRILDKKITTIGNTTIGSSLANRIGGVSTKSLHLTTSSRFLKDFRFCLHHHRCCCHFYDCCWY